MAFQPLTHDQLLALWRRLFPAAYTVPIEEENNGQGLDVFAQQAAQFARGADAAAVTTQAYYLRPHSSQVRPEAMGALAATGTVEFTRAAPAAGAITIPVGTVLLAVEPDSRGGEAEIGEFRLTSAVVLPAGVLGPISAPVACLRVGYQGNVPANTVVRFQPLGTASVPATVGAGNAVTDTGVPDRFQASFVGRYVRFVGGLNSGTVPRRVLSFGLGTIVVDGPALAFPDTSTVEVEEWADLSITLAQPAPMAGGRHGWLDAIAEDRGTSRQFGETDEDLRLRLTNLADVVSPAAISRAAARVLDPFGIPWRLLETRDPASLVGMVWDFHAFDYGTISNGVVFAPATRVFVLLVGNSGLGEFGFPYDTPYPPGGNAWDFGCMDGYPAGYYGLLASLWAAIEQTRAAGVGWLLVRDLTL
jgi:hypothetical protein